MIVKESRSPTLDRIRDNQRRSRARRKEYIEQLEERVRTFERLGVQAGAELQVVAQKAAVENSLLRDLLGQRGITFDEVEAYLSDRWAGLKKASPTSDSRFLPRSLLASLMNTTDCLKRSDPKAMAEKPGSLAQYLQTTAPLSSAPRFELNASEPAIMPASVQTPPVQQLVEEHFSPVNPHHLPNDTEKTSLYERVDNVTSCEEAAYIIASLRGHDKLDEVRAELGCSLKKDCKVTNLAIFEAMDQ